MPISWPFSRSTSEQNTALNWVVVGLGNPGPKYAGTRHNIGFEIINRLADRANIVLDENRFNGVLGRGMVASVRTALVKPLTMMNLSGKTVAPLARFYKVPPERILVVYDDLDLPTARLRLRPKGGPGGHNGVRSIIEHLGSQEFPRLRIGIDRPPGRMASAAYVLQKFSPAEAEAMEDVYPQALAAIEALLEHGLDYAMNQFN